jgi:hypothetical protein
VDETGAAGSTNAFDVEFTAEVEFTVTSDIVASTINKNAALILFVICLSSFSTFSFAV